MEQIRWAGSPLAALASSRKFWVVALVLLLVGVGVALGRVTTDQALSFAKWIVVAWLGAVATEDGARNLASRPSPSVTAVAQSDGGSSGSGPPAPPVLPAATSSASSGGAPASPALQRAWPGTWPQG